MSENIPAQIEEFIKQNIEMVSNIVVCVGIMTIVLIIFKYIEDFIQCQHRKYLDSLIERRYVKGYKRKDGKYIKGYYRRKHK
ncbi:hypothetical protein NUACC26_083280 [Scytonema sp. NUACC26]